MSCYSLLLQLSELDLFYFDFSKGVLMKFLYSVLLPIVLTGCVSQQIANTKKIDDSVLKMASQSKLSVKEACTNASIALSEGDKEDLHYYSPLHMRQAKESLEAAQDVMSSHDPLVKKQALVNCLKVDKLITDGIAIKAKALSKLDRSFKQLEMLKDVDNNHLFTEDIRDFKDDIKDIIETIEAGKMNQAMQEQEELMADMREQEIEIVLSKHMPLIESALDKAEDMDAEKYAEVTYEKAEKEIEATVKYINQNYRNNKAVKKAVDHAVLACKHAYFISEEVQTLEGMKPNLAEQRVLHYESLLTRINKSLALKPAYGQSLYSQSVSIAKAVESIKASKSLNATD